MNEICGRLIRRAVNGGLVPGEVLEFHWYPKSERAEIWVVHPIDGGTVRIRTKDVRRAMRRACPELGVGEVELGEIQQASELGDLELLGDSSVSALMYLAVVGRIAA